MTRKTLLTSGLLVFVAASLTFAVADMTRWRRHNDSSSGGPARSSSIAISFVSDD